MVNNKRFIYASQFKGEPQASNFKLLEESLPKIKDGEILCKAVYLSVDPYMRAYGPMLKIGNTMFGGQVAQIIESKHKDYKVGANVVASFGWQLYTICNPDNNKSFFGTEKPRILPDFGNLPLSLGLGVLGMPGNTAYFGFLEICKPQPKEVVVVSGAAGAVGSHVGQIAKIKGCKVIGIAGSEEKVQWLKEELKFDEVINYKTQDVRTDLAKAAPEGVDCYFDNVGGEISSAVISLMNAGGRISVCGSISVYNKEILNYGQCKATVIQPFIVQNELKIEGFIANRWLHVWDEGIKQNMEWLKEGKLQYKETVYEGFEKMPEALIGIMKGENIGKAVIKV